MFITNILHYNTLSLEVLLRCNTLSLEVLLHYNTLSLEVLLHCNTLSLEVLLHYNTLSLELLLSCNTLSLEELLRCNTLSLELLLHLLETQSTFTYCGVFKNFNVRVFLPLIWPRLQYLNCFWEYELKDHPMNTKLNNR